MKKSRFILAVLASSALIVAACGGSDGGTEVTEAPSTEAPSTDAPVTEERTASDIGVTADTIKIGFVTPLTGPLALFGEADKWTVEQMKQTFKDGITVAGKKYSVVYRLEKGAECWRIVDMKIEGVSMIANWRAQLNPLFQHGGAPEVLASLKQNLSNSVAK